MKTTEELQFTFIGKFLYGLPELDDLRIQIPKQLNAKGDYTIGFLRNHHILMRFEPMENFVNVMAKSMYYIIAKDGYPYQMRSLIYDAKFKIDKSNISIDKLSSEVVKKDITLLNSGDNSQSGATDKHLENPTRSRMLLIIRSKPQY
ncbi:hypothetical protein CQW23_16763 [Capsicum baccatum]|uniref:DUF4283 domain-containing protein n=1 Tax=Capsicum baccatum TaxID=33114 RepID=A0A2G2WBX9_CAPBA|nr:hypothetical protein CQW23_16763 [Capsicum baccatum]